MIVPGVQAQIPTNHVAPTQVLAVNEAPQVRRGDGGHRFENHLARSEREASEASEPPEPVGQESDHRATEVDSANDDEATAEASAPSDRLIQELLASIR